MQFVHGAVEFEQLEQRALRLQGLDVGVQPRGRGGLCVGLQEALTRGIAPRLGRLFAAGCVGIGMGAAL